MRLKFSRNRTSPWCAAIQPLAAAPHRAAGPGHLGRRPRVRHEGQPEVPPARRRRLHHRGEAALRLRRGDRGPVAAGPLQDRRREPAGQGGPPARGGDRFIVCFNPDQAVRDAAVRANLISMLEELVAGSGQLSVTKRAEPRGKVSTMPGRTGSCALPPAACCAPTRPGRRPRPTSAARTCCAAPTRT